MKVIRIDDQVVREIKKHWKPEDTWNKVLRRILKIDRRKKK